MERFHDVAEYIAKDNPDAAVKCDEGLLATVERLADFPERGRRFPRRDHVASWR